MKTTAFAILSFVLVCGTAAYALSMDFEYIKPFVTVGLAFFGWIVAHYFTNKRIVASKQRDLITVHLVNSYRILANDISQRAPNPDRDKELEGLVADIQLFGNSSQIEKVKKLVSEIRKGGNFDLDPLINDLRNDLRTRLELEAVLGNVHWVRI